MSDLLKSKYFSNLFLGGAKQYKLYYVVNIMAVMAAVMFSIYSVYIVLYYLDVLYLTISVTAVFLSLAMMLLNLKGKMVSALTIVALLSDIVCLLLTLKLGIYSGAIWFIFVPVTVCGISSGVPVWVKAFIIGTALISINIALIFSFYNPDIHNKLIYIGPVSFISKNLVFVFVVIILLFCNVMNKRSEERYENKIEKAKKTSMIDPLTKLWNRRYLDKVNNEELENSVFAMLDIDFFKKINDKYGHSIGDNVLIDMANHMRKSFRKTDVIIRWGGEEFLIILPNIELDKAFEIMKNLKSTVSKTSLDIGEKENVNYTFSCGLVPFKKGDNTDDVIKNADLKMYEAKKTGRNKVVK